MRKKRAGGSPAAPLAPMSVRLSRGAFRLPRKHEHRQPGGVVNPCGAVTRCSWAGRRAAQPAVRFEEENQASLSLLGPQGASFEAAATHPNVSRH